MDKGWHIFTNSLWHSPRALLPILLLIAPAFFFSCSRQEDPFEETLVLTDFRILSSDLISDLTKSFQDLTESTDDDLSDIIQSIDIFVFNDDALRRLDSYEHIEHPDGNSLRAVSTAGPKIIAVLANCPSEVFSFTTLMCYDDLAGIKMHWDDDSEDFPFMSGEVKIQAGVEGVNLVYLRDLCSVVEISEIVSSESFVPKSVRLENLNAFCELLGDNSSRPVEYVPVGKSSEYYPGVELRCYPNSSTKESIGSPMTELVLEGLDNGTPKSYRVKVNGFSGLKRGSRYSLKLSVADNAEGTVVENGSLTLFPGNILTGHDGDSLRVWVEVYPENTEVVFDREDLEFDKERGIYDYRVDSDGKGVTLYLLRGGTGMFCIDAGDPVNDGCLVIVVCNP